MRIMNRKSFLKKALLTTVFLTAPNVFAIRESRKFRGGRYKSLRYDTGIHDEEYVTSWGLGII